MIDTHWEGKREEGINVNIIEQNSVWRLSPFIATHIISFDLNGKIQYVNI